MNWIKHPVTLKGNKVHLLPLEREHFDALAVLAKDERIWTYLSLNGTDKEELLLSLKSSLLKRAAGEEYPFVAVEKATGKIFGTTRFMEIEQQNKGLEIGWTWYHPDYWRTGYNRECKLLLLSYCFEELKTIRVQLKTWDKNTRSRTAIENLGAKFEGVLRNRIIRYDGIIRDSAFYSIIDTEWNEVKQKLKEKIRT
ncbi:MAG TPA: GNAT family protein [Flavipsychrobacter sp.]|nr:GNAT family protein [Flavipsychrobacter sp.]